MKKVMAFGTFDGIHDGHRSFLRQARSCGDYLVVVIPQDSIVVKLKGRLPKNRLDDRIAALRSLEWVDEVAAGDAEIGDWKVVDAHRPDVVAVGHDQALLRADLEAYLKGSDPTPEIRMMALHGGPKKRDGST